MPILDCETINSTYSSLSDITGVAEDSIHKFLMEINIEDYCIKHKQSSIGNVELYKIFKKEFNSKSDIDYIYWFHLTRAFNESYMQEGLLPLGLTINRLWDNLFELISYEISHSDWEQFKKQFLNGSLNNHYARSVCNKIADKRQWGPYAVLVKDVVFSKHTNVYYHYFKTPETVTHICLSFKEKFDIDLLSIFQKNTRPCIVKFRHTGSTKEDKKEGYIKNSLYFLYCSLHGVKINSYCNSYFVGDGKTIFPNDIDKVVFLDD